ncbi:hypothetical protein BJG92_01199 [Arthrobacter sp. SO5]|uniref:hypothetical protein n=1 Tax=Arthrobacter sp. SO5 TaxID=1897055 RepID=UPI001E5CBBC1|nr:hypothetical protein [Arthrobacter sp. SO5]MCB5273675.1 hypothetical protein [Arthrobacter sp. SO5]
MISKGMAFAVFLTGALALSGCGSSNAETAPAATSATATPTPTVTAPPANGGTYSTVVALKSAYVKAGGSCPEFSQTNKVTLAAESADCSKDTVISTYVSSSDISQLIQNVKKLNAQVKSTGGNSWLVGENWVINSPTAAKVQEELGGKLVSF